RQRAATDCEPEAAQRRSSGHAGLAAPDAKPAFHRESAGAHRRTHRTRQPSRPLRTPGTPHPVSRHRHASRFAADRSRSLQADQRRVRSSRRRSGAVRGCRRSQPRRLGLRSALPHRRRRIRPARPTQRSDGARSAGRAHRFRHSRTPLRRATGKPERLDQHRRRPVRRQCRLVGVVQPRGCGAVQGQGAGRQCVGRGQVRVETCSASMTVHRGIPDPRNWRHCAFWRTIARPRRRSGRARRGRMNAVADEAKPQIPASVAPAPLLRAVLVCDLADSAQLTQRLGDVEAAELAQRLDRIARDLVYHHRGQEIDKSDGFLLLFERPVYAVAFALDYQRRLRELATAESLPLSARIGIHVGDVVLWENTPDDVARGAKPTEVEGLAKPVAARLMSLALPGQILISAVACMLAQRAQAELVAQRAPPQWKMHGRYQFKGVAEPLQVYEVGETGIAPLKRPAYSGKAHREVPWWRRPGMLALEAAALIAAVAAPAYLWLRSPPAIAFAQRDWVVIGDLNNLTREIVLDGSLESAFRLGLEQSRYVNVMSDLKVRDTLTLMQRDSAHTRVDRAIGSEVAIRDGARALIIPTVAEVGGHVRVTAEVIDPKTQTTVYTESADGKGLNSVLPTIDAIDQKLRLRLGEALAAVSETNKPLEQAATPNLDALRAYSLGQRAYVTGNMKDALAFYRDAVRLDPQFATAHMVIARVLLNAEQNSEALKQIELAAAM